MGTLVLENIIDGILLLLFVFKVKAINLFKILIECIKILSFNIFPDKT